MYDPSIGRWLEEDPLGFEAGDANLYRYVGNGPTNAIDPSGKNVPPPEPPGIFNDIQALRTEIARLQRQRDQLIARRGAIEIAISALDAQHGVFEWLFNGLLRHIQQQQGKPNVNVRPLQALLRQYQVELNRISVTRTNLKRDVVSINREIEALDREIEALRRLLDSLLKGGLLKNSIRDSSPNEASACE